MLKDGTRGPFSRKGLFVLMAGILGMPAVTFAEDMGVMVVTATRTERDIADVPASVTVITAEEIENSAAQSADELIQDLAGVDSLHTIGVLSTSTSNKISLRGLGGGSEARTLLLIDGVPANDLSVGAIEWNQIPKEDIERIEIVRGPTSAIYGSNAMGGVINIITKSATKEPQGRVKLGYGSLNTREGNASLSGTNGKVGYRLAGGAVRSDGYQSLPENKQNATSIDQGMERENLSGNISYQMNDASSFDLKATHFHEQKTGSQDIAGFNPYEQLANDFTGKYLLNLDEGRQFSAQLYGKRNESSYDSANYATGYTSTSYTSTATQDRVGGNLQYTAPVATQGGTDHIVTTGLEFSDGKIDRLNTYRDGSNRVIKIRGSQRYAALYLQDEIFTHNDAMIINIGGRYDSWKNYNGYGYDDNATPVETNYADSTLTAFNPKLSALYRVSPATAIRGSVGKAFRAPTLNDLYSTFVWGTSVWAGNPQLDPETVLSYEVGMEQKIGGAGNMSLTFYRNNAKDFIGFITPDPVGNPSYREKQNIGEVSTQGVELELRYRMSKEWTLSANATYNRSVVEKYAANPAIEGNLLPESPEQKASLSLSYVNPALLTAKATVRHVGERYNDDANKIFYDSYTLVDLHMAKDLGKTYAVSLDVSDLFDKGYTEYYVSPGRTVMANVSAKF
jgi:iron complex outermembrane receptor protein